MPIYVYQALEAEKGCKKCGPSFELRQSIMDESLTHCPECQAPIQRVIQPVGIGKGWNKNLLSDKNLKEKGFTKLVNEGNGKFTKAV